mgnify:CR=1 FL=1
MGKLENFNVAEFGLNPVHLEVWGGLLWVHFGQPEKSVSQTYPGLTNYLDPDDLAGLRFVQRREYPLACNWKVFVDNYLDGGYHVPFAHPALVADGVDMKKYETEIFGEYVSVQTVNGGEFARFSAEDSAAKAAAAKSK